MKKYLIGGIFVCSLCSCLKDVNSVFNPGETPAVVRRDRSSDLIVADTRYGAIYSTRLNSNAEGKCLLVEFTYDASNAENMNVEQNGYYTVNLLNQTSVYQTDIKSEGAARTSLLSNEQPVLEAVVTGEEALFTCIDNYLFLPSAYLTTTSQRVNWELAYDPHPSAVVVDNIKTYPLYLRAWATTGRAEEALDTALVAVNAFQIESFVQAVREQGEWDEREGLYVILNYINYIDARDSTRYEWARTRPLQIK